MIEVQENGTRVHRCAVCGHGTCPTWCNAGEQIGRWVALGACSDVDPDVFYPEEYSGWQARSLTLEAKQICSSCPVRVDCLEYAVEERLDHGIWGGTTPGDRRGRRKELLELLKKRRANEQRLEEIR